MGDIFSDRKMFEMITKTVYSDWLEMELRENCVQLQDGSSYCKGLELELALSRPAQSDLDYVNQSPEFKQQFYLILQNTKFADTYWVQESFDCAFLENDLPPLGPVAATEYSGWFKFMQFIFLGACVYPRIFCLLRMIPIPINNYRIEHFTIVYAVLYTISAISVGYFSIGDIASFLGNVTKYLFG